MPQNRKKGWITRWTGLFLLGMIGGSLLLIGLEMRILDSRRREALLARTRLVAGALNPVRIQSLSGTPADRDAPDYQRLKEQLICTKTAVAGCRFLYLMGMRANGSIFFLVDSEPPDSDQESPPGQIYDEITAADRIAFTERRELTSGPAEDRWGTWISAMVPLTDPDTGALVAVLGMDYDAVQWQRAIWRALLPQALLSLSVVAVFGGGLVLIARRSQAVEMPPFKRRYLQTVLAIAVGGIFLSVSTTWFVRDRELHVRKSAFRQMAGEKAAGIERFFQSVIRIELEALARFFGASETVTQSEFDTYTSSLLQNPVAGAWLWGRPVRSSDRYEVERDTRITGVSRFVIWEYDAEGKRIPAGLRGIYYPVFRITSLPENRQAVGFDLGSEPLRREALEKAVRSGYATGTYPISRTPVNSSGKVVAVFRPVYRSATNSHLQGVVGVELQMEKIPPTETESDMIALELVMGHPVAAFETLTASRSGPAGKDSGIFEMYPVFAFGRAFLIEARAGSRFVELYPARTGWILGGAGILLTALMVGFVQVIHRKREELEVLVANRTRDLVEAKYRMELAVIGADLATWDWDLRTDEMVFSGNWADMMGYPEGASRMHLSGYYAIIHPDDRTGVINAMKKHAAGNSDSCETEHRLAHHSGNWIWVLSRGRAIESSPGRIAERICGTCLDITERRQAEAALITSRAHLRTLIDTLPDLVWLKDPDGVYLSCNKRFERFFGAAECEIVGRTDYDFVDQQLADFFREKDRAAMAAGKPCINEETITYADDGHREILETIKMPMADAQGRVVGILGIARNITERKQAEAEREKLLKQLNRSQKMEAIGRLAGGVAHDLNNLLAPVIGYGELLLGDMETGDTRRKQLEQILNAGFRARDLVAQLLAYSRKQALAFSPVDINAIIENFLPLLKRTIPEDIEIIARLAAELRPVMADAGQIEQVIMNLAVNAGAAMPEGGRLIIETAVMELDATAVSSHLELDPGFYVMLIISDDGQGMDEETREHIFEPFFSTKGELGTGLGLSTVFGIVRQHNGNVWVYSEPGKGTSFKIYLPAAEDVPAAREVTKTADISPGGTETVLVVEDNEEVRQLACSILGHLGYRILSAVNGEDALQVMAAFSDPVHLLLTDVVMPGINSKELYQELLRVRPDLRVLYMSGYTDDVIAHRGVLEDGVHFIQKPFTIQALAAKVRVALER